jgi:hypothetical protein
MKRFFKTLPQSTLYSFGICLVFFLGLAVFIPKPYFSTQFPYTHDGENHLARFANYKIALREGQFPPRFAPNLVNHYGYPVFNYNYPLANILSTPFSILKINYEITFKIIVFGFVIFALLSIDRWLKLLGFEKKARLFSLALFSTTPYLISAITFRGNIGEIMALCLLPGIFWIVERSQKKLKKKELFLAIIIWTMFFLSHNVTVLFGTPLVILYALFRFGRKLSHHKLWVMSMMSGIGLSLWFWLPAVLEKNLIILDQADLSKNFVGQFPTFNQLLFSPLEFGFSKIGSLDSLSFSLGLVQILVFILGGILLIKKKMSQKLKFFWIIILVFILSQLSFTSFLWEIIPLANFIQFPWRLSLFIGILILPLGAFIFEKSQLHFKALLLFLVFVQVLGILRLKPADYFHKDNLTYDRFFASTSTANENMSKEFTFEYFGDDDWRPTAKIISGDEAGVVENIKWTGSEHLYNVSVEQKSTIIEPTMNFAGWETRVDGELIEHKNDEEIRGRIGFELKPGKHKIETKFTQNTWPRIAGNGASILTGLILILYFIIFRKNE